MDAEILAGVAVATRSATRADSERVGIGPLHHVQAAASVLLLQLLESSVRANGAIGEMSALQQWW